MTELTVLVVRAVRALESIWPPKAEQNIETFLFRAIFTNEFGKTETFLELNFVPRHTNHLRNCAIYCNSIQYKYGLAIVVIR